MAGKNDTTRHGAPAGGAETTGGQLPQSQHALSEATRRPPRAQDFSAAEQANMHTTGPGHDLEVPRGMLDRTLQAQLGRQLRSIYSDIASEPVPERFIRLLEELEAKEKRQ